MTLPIFLLLSGWGFVLWVVIRGYIEGKRKGYTYKWRPADPGQFDPFNHHNHH